MAMSKRRKKFKTSSSGKRDEAFSKVPDDYIDRASLTGDEGGVRERIEVYKEVELRTNIDIPSDTENLSSHRKVKVGIAAAPSANERLAQQQVVESPT